MDFLKNITKRVSDTAKVAAKKSGDMVEHTKLKMNIASEEEKIEKEYTRMGKILFESFENGEKISDVFEKNCENIVEINESIKAMKEQILRLKNVKICPDCGGELDSEVAFCPKCGSKQEMLLIPIEEDSKEDDIVEIIESVDLTNEIDKE